MDDNRLVLNYPETSTDESGGYMSKLKQDEWTVREIADKPFYTTQDVADIIGARGRSTIRMAVLKNRITPMTVDGIRDNVFSFEEVKRFAETYKIAVKIQLTY